MSTTDYLIVSPDWNDAVHSEVLGFESFDEAYEYAAELAEQLQQQVKLYQSCGTKHPAAYYMTWDDGSPK